MPSGFFVSQFPLYQCSSNLFLCKTTVSPISPRSTNERSMLLNVTHNPRKRQTTKIINAYAGQRTQKANSGTPVEKERKKEHREKIRHEVCCQAALLSPALLTPEGIRALRQNANVFGSDLVATAELFKLVIWTSTQISKDLQSRR